MTDERTQQEADATAREEETEHALSKVLTAQFWTCINDPAAQWPRHPKAVGEASAGLFLQVILALAVDDSDGFEYGLRLIADVQQQFIERTGAPMPTSH